MADQQESTGGLLVGVLGQVVTLVIVGIPAVGLTMRIASIVRYTGPTLTIAASASVPQLAAAAMLPVCLAMFAGLVAIFTWHRGGAPVTKGSATWWLLCALLVVLVFGSILFLPGFPGGAVVVLSSIPAAFFFRRVKRSKASPRAWDYWPGFLVVVVSAFVWSAVSGGVISYAPADVTFAPGSAIADGPYIILAADGPTSFLVPCGSSDIVSVPADSIRSASYFKGRRDGDASLFQRLRGAGWDLPHTSC